MQKSHPTGITDTNEYFLFHFCCCCCCRRCCWCVYIIFVIFHRAKIRSQMELKAYSDEMLSFNVLLFILNSFFYSYRCKSCKQKKKIKKKESKRESSSSSSNNQRLTKQHREFVVIFGDTLQYQKKNCFLQIFDIFVRCKQKFRRQILNAYQIVAPIYLRTLDRAAIAWIIRSVLIWFFFASTPTIGCLVCYLCVCVTY